MPRPKRTKVASSAAQPTRVAAPSNLATTTASRLSAPRALSGRTSEHSDDSLGLVTTVPRSRRGRQSAQQPQQDVTMTGALGEGNVRGAHRANARPRQLARRVAPEAGQTKALDALRARRDEAMRAKSRQAAASSPAQVQQAPAAAQPPKSVIEVSSTATSDTEDLYAMPSPRPAQKTPQAQAAPVAPMSRTEAPASAGQTAQRTAKASSPRGQPIPLSTAKAQSTPGPETSVLALANFRRRPRQPSILRMVEQNNDHEDDTLGDFNPDDESTPLGTHKVTVPSSAVAGTSEEARTSSSRKRKHSSLEPESEVQVPRSSPPLISSPTAAHGQDHESDEPSSLPERLPDTQEAPANGVRDQSPEIWSETMAPPKSSSPLRRSQDQNQQTAPPPAKRRGRPPRGRTAELSDDEDAATTPARPKRAAQPTSAKKASGLTTATLASLLPQRRRRPRDARARSPFEIPSSSPRDQDTAMHDSDGDELQQAPARRGRGAKRAQATTARTPNKSGRGGTGKLKSPVSARKTTASRTTTASTTAGKRTYGRRRSDAENHPNGNESSGLSSPPGSDEEDEGYTTVTELVSKSKELAAAKQKFEEVDQWELSFESVDLVGGTSSPWR